MPDSDLTFWVKSQTRAAQKGRVGLPNCVQRPARELSMSSDLAPDRPQPVVVISPAMPVPGLDPGIMTTLTSLGTGFEVRAIAPAVLADLRSTDDAGNVPMLLTDTEGGAPLRCCLRRIRPGEQVALVSYAAAKVGARDRREAWSVRRGRAGLHSCDRLRWPGRDRLSSVVRNERLGAARLQRRRSHPRRAAGRSGPRRQPGAGRIGARGDVR